MDPFDDPREFDDPERLAEVERDLRAFYLAAGLDPDKEIQKAAASLERWQAMTPVERQEATDRWEAEQRKRLELSPGATLDLTGGCCDEPG